MKSGVLCRYKWGLQKDGPPHSCKIEVEGLDGKKVLRQEPFQTLDELYVPLTRTSSKDLDDTPGRVSAAERQLRMF